MSIDVPEEGLAPIVRIEKDSRRLVLPKRTDVLDLASYEPVYLGLPYIFPAIGVTYDLLRTYQMQPNQPPLHPRLYTTRRPLISQAPEGTHPSWLHMLVLIPKDEWPGFLSYASGCQFVDRQRKTFVCLGHQRVSVARPSWDSHRPVVAAPPAMSLHVICFADCRGACILTEPDTPLGPAKITYWPKEDESIRQMGRAILREDPVEYVRHVLGPVTVPKGRPLTPKEWWGLFVEGDPTP